MSGMKPDVREALEWLRKAALQADMSSLTMPYGKALATLEATIAHLTEENERLQVDEDAWAEGMVLASKRAEDLTAENERLNNSVIANGVEAKYHTDEITRLTAQCERAEAVLEWGESVTYVDDDDWDSGYRCGVRAACDRLRAALAAYKEGQE